MEQATISAARRSKPTRRCRPAPRAGAAAGAPLRARPARLPRRAAAPLRRHLHGPLPLLRPDRLRRRPDLVKERLHRLARAASTPARRTRPCSSRRSGPNSVLTLDDAPHMRQRKLLLPPFHGERIERYGELILEMTRAEMESWPVGEPFALRPHTQRITLAVIMRAVFGVHDEERLARFEGLIDDFARRVGVDHRLPAAAPQPRPAQPLAALPALARGARRVHLRGDRAAPRRGRGRRGARRRALAAARRPPRRRQPDERRGAARRAGHRARRRPRDDRDRPRLGDGAAAAQPARCWRSCATRSPPARTTTSTRRSRRRCGRGR